MWCRLQKCRRFAKAASAFAILEAIYPTLSPFVIRLPRYLDLLTAAMCSPQSESLGIGSYQSRKIIFHFEDAQCRPRLDTSMTRRFKNTELLCIVTRFGDIIKVLQADSCSLWCVALYRLLDRTQYSIRIIIHGKVRKKRRYKTTLQHSAIDDEEWQKLVMGPYPT